MFLRLKPKYYRTIVLPKQHIVHCFVWSNILVVQHNDVFILKEHRKITSKIFSRWESGFWISVFGYRAILLHKQHIVHCMVQYPCCTAREDGTIKYHSIPPRPRIPEGKRQNCHNLFGPHNNYNTIIFLNINIKVLGQDTNQIALVVNEAPFVINL